MVMLWQNVIPLPTAPGKLWTGSCGFRQTAQRKRRPLQGHNILDSRCLRTRTGLSFEARTAPEVLCRGGAGSFHSRIPRYLGIPGRISNLRHLPIMHVIRCASETGDCHRGHCCQVTSSLVSRCGCDRGCDRGQAGTFSSLLLVVSFKTVLVTLLLCDSHVSPCLSESSRAVSPKMCRQLVSQDPHNQTHVHMHMHMHIVLRSWMHR